MYTYIETDNYRVMLSEKARDYASVTKTGTNVCEMLRGDEAIEFLFMIDISETEDEFNAICGDLF